MASGSASTTVDLVDSYFQEITTTLADNDTWGDADNGGKSKENSTNTHRTDRSYSYNRLENYIWNPASGSGSGSSSGGSGSGSPWEFTGGTQAASGTLEFLCVRNWLHLSQVFPDDSNWSEVESR